MGYIGRDVQDSDGLYKVGLRDGEVMHLESYRDLFLTNLEGGSYAMGELFTKLPKGDDDEEGGHM